MENRLYDADAQQRVPMVVMAGGERYDVSFSFRPLEDDLAIEFIETDDANAAANIFKRLIQSAEGCEDEDGTLFTADSLAELVPQADQEFAINSALMGTRLLPAPKASKKLNWRNPPTTATYKMAAYFDGGEVITTHKLNLAGTEHHRVFAALERKAFPVKFGDSEIRSYGRGLMHLYKALVAETNGYAGRVPAHHQMVIIVAHLRGQRELLLGK